MVNYKTAGYKTKEDAVGAILADLVKNPAVAGADGTLMVSALGQTYVLKPIKKKEKV
jgi:hypothetical protein